MTDRTVNDADTRSSRSFPLWWLPGASMIRVGRWHLGALVLAVGALSWLPAMRARQGMRLREGFITVALFWTVLGIAGSLPLILADRDEFGIDRDRLLDTLTTIREEEAEGAEEVTRLMEARE